MKHKLKYIILGQDKNGNSIDVPEPNFESINISNSEYTHKKFKTLVDRLPTKTKRRIIDKTKDLLKKL